MLPFYVVVLALLSILPSCASLPAPKTEDAPAPRADRVEAVLPAALDQETLYVCGTFEDAFRCITWEQFLEAREAMEAGQPKEQSYDGETIEM